MRVTVSPRGLSVVPGRPSRFTVTVTNTSTVISGHALRVLGLDPQWVRVDTERISLFPDTSGDFTVTLLVPDDLPAGARTIGVEVRELNPPHSVVRRRVELTVPSDDGLELALDPASVTGGKKIDVGVVIENTGNTERTVELQGADQEGVLGFRFTPPAPTLAPGERLVATARLSARRPLVGSPKVRSYTVSAGDEESPQTAFGAFVQRPRLTRGNLSLLGLVAAITVFAIVISATLSQVVNQSNANRDLALQVAEASQTSGAGGTASIAGLVTLNGTNAPVSGVTVNLYGSGDTAQPIVSTATALNGAYGFSGLVAGNYKLSFAGAGFVELWYPESLSPTHAGVVTVTKGQKLQNVDIRIGGAPASISGSVAAPGLTAATVSVELPAGKTVASSNAVSPGTVTTTTVATKPGANPPPPVIVATTTISSSGSFSFTKLPSPAVYNLVVNAPGYAPATEELNLSGGANRTGVTVTLHKGDGAVSGTIDSVKGPIGGATLTATTGTTSVTTITATTKGKVGDFLLASLPTPTTLTLVASAPGYASQTLTVSLAAAQKVTGIAITLLPGVGSISGTVKTPPGTPAGGVTVTVSNGSVSLATATLSSNPNGGYTVSGLPVPGTYTVTFARSDLASQTQAVGLTTSVPRVRHIDVAMVAETASIAGKVTDKTGAGVGEVAVALVSGATKYATTSASLPAPGEYAMGGLTPGTYNLTFTRQGGVPTSIIVNLKAGQQLVENEILSPAAAIDGYVVLASTNAPVPGAEVNLYLSSAYPTQATATTTTDATGAFSFANVAAPQSYIVAVSYPQGTSPQQTIFVNTTLGKTTPVCGSAATGTPTTTASTTTTTTTAPSTASSATTGSSSTTSSTTTSSTTTTVALTPGSATATCTPQTDPVTVSVP